MSPPVAPHASPWSPDPLGPDWSQAVLDLTPDLPGDTSSIATLIRRAPASAPTAFAPDAPAILYIHGFADYFFQAHVGDHFAAAGFAFYAIDLRRYGRSLRTGEPGNYVADLSVYREELDLAARAIRGAAGHSRLTVLGHSTGGLIASLWAAHRWRAGSDHAVDALVLNSPWLAMQGSSPYRAAAAILSGAIAPIAPRLALDELSVHYRDALHVDTGGEFDFDLRLRPRRGFPARAAWLRAIRRGQAQVRRGLGIGVPILLCAARESGNRFRPHDRLLTTDSVLDAQRLVDRAEDLGPDVTVARFEGAHDLASSPARLARST